MSDFKCINCDQIKESEEKCSCSRCGYTMYELPYDKKTLLLKECRRFLQLLLSSPIKAEYFDFYRIEQDPETGEEITVSKAKDDARFPGFEAIERYILGAKRSEESIQRAKTTLEELKSHLSTPYRRKYRVHSGRAHQAVCERDQILSKAMMAVGASFTPGAFILPDFTLHYDETPDGEILSLSLQLVGLLDALADKMLRFIKQNNAYGAINASEGLFQEMDDRSAPSCADALTGQISVVSALLRKVYVIDILSDGFGELQEMLDAFLKGVRVLLTYSALIPSCCYQFEDGEIVFGEGFLGKINAVLAQRYENCQVFVLQNLTLDALEEDALFRIYDSFIDLDEFGVFRANKTGRLRAGAARHRLESLIGLGTVKSAIDKITAYAASNKDSLELNLHMCFYGNPGTGKTEVARIIAGIFREIGVLPSDHVVEVDRGDLVGAYVGETALKTARVIQKAMGGILFIDEAYSLFCKDTEGDYGHEAIATLIKAMEDKRGRFCVILAGYKNQMQDMIASNPGFRSRIQFELDFPNYSRDELGQIVDFMLASRGYTLTDEAKGILLDITDLKRKEPNFANAREVRNILEQVIMCQSMRAVGTRDRELGLVDVKKYVSDMGLPVRTTEDGGMPKIRSAEEELDALIGLETVKRMVKKIRAYAKRNTGNQSLNLHMCFYGNPGTGKTEVARIISRILYDAGVLPEAKLVEIDAHGLIGKYIGETAPKTEAQIADAMGGVLFIDEAYSLCETALGGGISAGYGDEAIAVLLKRMEDARGKFCVVLAGYQKAMQRMLSSNPGLASRIQFALEFPDYTREELGEILNCFLDKTGYAIEDAAAKKILDVAEYFRVRPNFANARTVRNILDQVIMNQNLRTEDEMGNNVISLSDVEDYIADEKITLSSSTNRRIGF